MQGKRYLPPQEVHIDLIFKSEAEARELGEELSRWTPSGGWSENAQDLFDILGVVRAESQ